MNRRQFIEIMHEHQLLNEATLTDIEVILNEYPFFQAARMLWIKNLNELDHIRFNNELKLAAVHIPDRARLFDLLHNKKIVPDIQEKNQIQKGNIDEFKGQSDTENSHNQITDADQLNKYESGYVSDTDFDGLPGTQNDFIKTGNCTEDIKHAFPQREENMVLPSADLLDYERLNSDYFNILEGENEIDFDEYRSFSAWLKLMRHSTTNNNSQVKPKPDDGTPSDKGVKKDLIDSFLKGGAKSRIKVSDVHSKGFDNLDISVKSLQDNDDLMTETLANIYIRQNHFSKAIEIFERLCLKYPEKNIYFAGRIKELEVQINNK